MFRSLRVCLACISSFLCSLWCFRRCRVPILFTSCEPSSSILFAAAIWTIGRVKIDYVKVSCLGFGYQGNEGIGSH